METVKLNFHLEKELTLIAQLINGLSLELTVLCEKGFTQILYRYTAAWSTSSGGAYESNSVPSREYLEITQIS
jgi:hypothetical protein